MRKEKVRACSPLWIYSSQRKATENGVCFSQTILHSKQQPCLHWKIPQYVETYRGTEWRDLEKKVTALIRLIKDNYARSKLHSALLNFLQKNKKSQILICLIFLKSVILSKSQKASTCSSTCHLPFFRHSHVRKTSFRLEALRCSKQSFVVASAQLPIKSNAITEQYAYIHTYTHIHTL